MTTSTRFPHSSTLSARKPDVKPSSFKYEVKQFKNVVTVLTFFDQQKGSVTRNENN